MITEIAKAFFLMLLTAGITWMFSRRKQRAELEKLDIENIKAAFDLNKIIADQLRLQCEDLGRQVQQLSSEVIKFRNENASLRNELSDLKALIKDKHIA